MDEAREWFADPVAEELPIARWMQEKIVSALKIGPISPEQVASVCLLAVAELEKLARFGE